MNHNNLSHRSNFIAGSEAFKDVPFMLTTLNIPGISLGHSQVGGRGSSKMFMSADVITWNALSFDMLIDEDFKVYTEVMDIVRKNLNVESGNFANFVFDFWIEINNNKGNKVLKLEFTNCRIESIGDISLDVQDDTTEHTLNISMVYDYYTIENIRIPTLTI